MPSTTLNIPVLVRPVEQEGKNEYHIRPLFLEHPVSVNRRYAKAVSAFKQEVKRRFGGYILNRKSMDNLFWFKFSPEVRLEVFHLEFSIGTNFLKGRFHVATFRYHGHMFGMLPNFGNYLFMMHADHQNKDDLKSQAAMIIQKLTKQYKKNLGDHFNPNGIYSNKKEFITIIQQQISVKDSKFSFEDEGVNQLLAMFRKEVYFEGGEEIEKN